MNSNSQRRFLIVNADDFGQAAGVNSGVIIAHEQGIVTSASLMVRWPAAGEAAIYARGHTELSVGLHIDLGEWAYRDDNWVRQYEVVPTDNVQAAQQEIVRQLEMFRNLLGKEPTHLDSHQHVHRKEPIRSFAMQLAGDLGVPLRDVTPGYRYCGDFYGQSDEGYPYPEGVSVANLSRILNSLAIGVTELACHPGILDELELNTQYLLERSHEVVTLSDPQIRQHIEENGIVLCSFLDVAGME